MAIDVKLQVFEGPLDLLLHLIEKNKIDIYDIPIVEITDQYLETIREMSRDQSLESMSEFLVMAATLLRIKSKMLLPREEDPEEEEDPRDELVRRLMEYKMYRYAAMELKDLSVDAMKVYYKPGTVPRELLEYQEPVNTREIAGDLSLSRLHEIFDDVLRRKSRMIDPVRSNFGKIRKEKFRVEDVMEEIRSKIEGLSSINFRTLLEAQSSKENVIVTFLAVLELMKLGQVSVVQEENFSDIILSGENAGT